MTSKKYIKKLNKIINKKKHKKVPRTFSNFQIGMSILSLREERIIVDKPCEEEKFLMKKMPSNIYEDYKKVLNWV
jgi:hypothetical protein